MEIKPVFLLVAVLIIVTLAFFFGFNAALELNRQDVAIARCEEEQHRYTVSIANLTNFFQEQQYLLELKYMVKLNETAKACEVQLAELNQALRKTPSPTSAPRPQDPQSVFDGIYHREAWGDYGKGSGPGSTRVYTTRTKEIIRGVVQKYNITSMLDAACGGMAWMPALLENLTNIVPNFQYMGVDVVHHLIVGHRNSFANHSNWRFQTCDVSVCSLPYGYELIFSRDALQHLSFARIFQFLQNVKETDSQYLLVGGYEKYENKNVPVGEYFSINLIHAPFNLPQPLEKFQEIEDRNGRKSLHLFSIDQLRTWEPSAEYKTD